MKDYYEILEVSRNASDNTIKKVFRMLVKNSHPDLFTGEEKIKAEKRIKKLNEAYEVLSNKELREKYDRELEQNDTNINETLETLIEENEYLKSVIEEKNRIFKEYLEEMGINTQNYTNQFSEESYNDYNENINNEYVETNNDIVYDFSEMLKKIGYTAGIIFVGIVVLYIFTGVNLLKIFISVLKAIF